MIIISSSYLIISFHPNSFQNHKKSTNFDIFRIQHVSTMIILVRNSQDLSSAINMSLWECLKTFKTQKRWSLMISLDFFFVFVIFSKKCDDFRVTTWKYAPRPLFSRFSATRVGSYPTNRPIINADRIERPKNRTPCDFGVLSDPHLLWAGVVCTLLAIYMYEEATYWRTLPNVWRLRKTEVRKLNTTWI